MSDNDEPYCIVSISNNTNVSALVSNQDFELVKNHKWSIYEQQSRSHKLVTIVTRQNGKLIRIHHFILGKPLSKFEIIVHKNNNKLDNRRCNLMVTSRKKNFVRKYESITRILDNEQYQSHPVLNNYVANVYGDVLRKSDHIQILGSKANTGYNQLTLTTTDGNKCYKQRHVFIYECFQGLVPKGHEIDHIDNNKTNNKLSNLQCLSVNEHHKKTAKDNPGTGQKTKVKLSKPIIAINIKSKEETKYSSLTEASNNLPGTTITKICSVLQGRRKSHQGYTFKYQEINEHIEDEIWVCLINPLFKGIEVSNLGRVKGKKGIITTGNYHGGYMRVSVSQENIKKCVFVHQLVCEAFNGKNPNPDENTVDHIDRNRNNNKTSNLRWASRYEQRLNTSDVKQVQVFDKNNVFIRSYDTITAAAIDMDVHKNTIKNSCLNCRKYKEYYFKFVDETNVDM
jgi:hypothetical protein